MSGGSLTNANGPTARAMRKRAGAWLKGLREEAGLTQRDLAVHFDYRYTTMISQIERGLGRVPAEDVLEWAALLRQEPRAFAKRCLYWYSPHDHYALFGGAHPQDAENLPREGTNSNRITDTGLAGRQTPKEKPSDEEDDPSDGDE